LETEYNIVMHVFTKKTILGYCNSYPNAREALLAWHADAEASLWTQPMDIRNTYGKNVSFVGDKVVIFNIKHNDFRLVVNLEYLYKSVYILWFGTHSEYDKINVLKI